MVELYEEFAKFSKSEVLHFCKLEQQRKTPKHDETLRPPRYNDNQRRYHKQVHSIDSDGYGPPRKKEARGRSITDQLSTSKEVAHQVEAAIVVEAHTLSTLRITCTTTVKPTIAQKITPSSSSPKEKWNKTPNSHHNNHRLEK
jgi:hypothetical protein